MPFANVLALGAPPVPSTWRASLILGGGDNFYVRDEGWGLGEFCRCEGARVPLGGDVVMPMALGACGE